MFYKKNLFLKFRKFPWKTSVLKFYFEEHLQTAASKEYWMISFQMTLALNS